MNAPAQALPALPPLALYLHFPWCVRKCPYCDFNSFRVQGEMPGADYLAALERDLRHQGPAVAGREVTSVFMGGGTPSLFAPDDIARVMETVRRELRLAADAEVTLGANPGTVERGRFSGYRDAGVNRVSLGAQSFDAGLLRRLGRIHGPQEIRLSAEELHAAGLDFNLDVMFALPGQTLAGAAADLREALALAPAHLSRYQLALEPGTVFAGQPPELPDDDLAWTMQQEGMEQLAAAGFAQYEVSAYARAGKQCRHNLNYWRFGDYLGVGAGAHGKITTAGPWRIERTQQPREPRRYMATPAAPGRERLAAVDLPFEFALNALRLAEGFTPALYAERTGLDPMGLSPTLTRLQARGLLEETAAGAWRTTALGYRFLNDVVADFLPQQSPAPRSVHSAGPVRNY